MVSHTVGSVTVAHVQLAEAKVAQSNVSCVIKQDVLWLEITIDDVESMKTF